MQFRFITPEKDINCPKIWKEFTASAVHAELKITGLGLYRAFLNGKRIGQDYLTPGFNDYDAYLRYQTYDVSELLQEENLLEVYLGNGWYKGRIGFGEKKDRIWGDKYYLALELNWTDASGESHRLVSDGSFLASESVFRENSIYDGEVRDDTFVPSEVVRCVEVKTAYQVESQFSPSIRIVETFKPELIITPKGDQVLDFGQNMAGTLRFVNRLPKGGKLYFQTGEVLQNAEFYRDNYRSALSEYTYISDGAVKEVEPWFTFYGFRYIRIQGVEKVNPEDYTALALSSDLKSVLTCETGNALINRLMKNAFWGQRSNFLDVPTDCPQRDERLGWTGDTQVFCNTACYQMDCKDFYRKFMKDLRADQIHYSEGFLPMISPCMKGWGAFGGAVWADAGTIVPMTVYEQYGDKELLRETYPMMRDYCEALIRHDESKGGSHVIFDCHTFGDWLAQDGLTPQYCWGGTKKEFIQGIYYYHSLELTAEAARILGEAEDEKRYRFQAMIVRAALLAEYFTPSGNLCIDTQTAYTIALKFGVYHSKEKLIEGFRYRLHRDFHKLKGGFTGAPLILPVLFDNGMEDEAFRMLMSEGFPGWLYCVKLGATTIWERWNSLDSDGNITGIEMNSLNHYAYGTVCEAIYSRIAGLQCAEPGWKKALVTPHMDARLGHLTLRFASPSGEWQVAWRLQEDGRVWMKVVVPEGCEAHIALPYHPEGFEEDVKAGCKEYCWMPTRDLLHPFGGESLLLDVLNCEQAKKVLAEVLPEHWHDWENSDNEYALKTLDEIGELAQAEGPEAFATQVREAIGRLRAVCV